ncbi:hypothetical protein ES708_29905 [subsurface metagenome]
MNEGKLYESLHRIVEEFKASSASLRDALDRLEAKLQHLPSVVIPSELGEFRDALDGMEVKLQRMTIPSAVEPKAIMEEWEYKTIQAGRKGHYNVIMRDEEELNELSRRGWELVTTFSTTGGRSGDEEKEKIFYIFRRRKASQ